MSGNGLYVYILAMWKVFFVVVVVELLPVIDCL